MFFNLEKIANTISSRMGKLHVTDASCSRVRSPLSKCSACVDICPVDALTFNLNQVVINASCFECGLCASVCPTAALSIQEPTELALISKVEQNNKADKFSIIGCQTLRPTLKIPKDMRHRLEINELACLGALSLEALLLLETMGENLAFALDIDLCKDCQVRGGGTHFLAQRKKAEKLAQDLSLEVNSLETINNLNKITNRLKTQEKISSHKQNEADHSRRAFLSSVLGGVKQLPKEIVDDFFATGSATEAESLPVWLEKIQTQDKERLSLLRSYLQKNYKELQAQGITELAYLEQIQLVKDCYFCKACSIMCPLGAIEQTSDHQLILDAGKCSGCNLCIDICVHESLELKPARIDDFLKAQKLVLAQTEEKTCSKCKQPIISTNPSDICFICARKPNFF